MRKLKLAGASVIAALFTAILLPAPAASAVQVPCVDPNFVHVYWHPTNGPTDVACFAGAGSNWFYGTQSVTSWMSGIHTGNNDVTYVGCNGDHVDFARNTDKSVPDWCVSWINIRPY